MLGLRDVLFIAPQNQTTININSSSSDHNHHHHQTNIPLPSSTSLGVGLGIFPLLTATPCITTPPPPPPPQPNPNPNHPSSCNPEAYHYWSLKKFQELNSSKQDDHHHQNQLLLGPNNNGDGDGYDHEREEEAQMVESDEGGNTSSRACKDCGNRAKKDCGFKRCRTCCKARGFDCSTHLRSTWVPAARRRERHEMMVLGSSAGGGAGGGDGSSGSSSGAKRPRILVPSQIGNNSGSHASTSNVNTPRSFDFGYAHQDASFKQSLPGKVRSPAVFRCHRVTAISNGEAEFAYQATVRISGHVFRGYLYDHGVDEKSAFPCISALHLEGNTRRRNGDSSSPVVNPSTTHPASAT